MIESIAVLFSIIYVILAAKQNIWCWLAAAISVTIYIYICYNAKLYAETGLQIFYLIMAIIGYFSWKNLNNKTEKLKLENSTITELKLSPVSYTHLRAHET